MGAQVDSLFLSCGETSGDQYASALARSLREEGYSGPIRGMAGPESAASGVEVEWSMDELRLMGITEVLGAIPRLFRLKVGITEKILAERPAAVVVIDSPDFHLPLLASLRKRGYAGKVVYLCPPTVWAWRSSRTKKLKRLCDLCLPLFSFEHEFLLRRGVRSRWIGHPLNDQLADFVPEKDLKERVEGKTVIGLLPGSRPQEVARLLPSLLEAGRRLREEGFCPLVSLAPFLPEKTRRFVREKARDFDIFEGPGAHVLAVSHAAAGASGTVAVEALMLKTFMVVLYKASFSSWLAYRLLVKTPWISIPNTLAGGTVFPELLQGDATAENILSALKGYFEKAEYRMKTESLMEQAGRGLGEKGAVRNWARSVLEEIGR
ncbi:MAG: lipid-A-disaccharide synthase [Thermovirgaceae bacterium]